MAETRICAVFVFNHRFERNIDKLETLYRDRFEHRFYLMPFAESTAPNVIRVAEASWLFAGHVWQGIRALAVERYTHLVFIADDLILNPSLDERNLLSGLNLPAGAAYIKSLASLDGARFRWAWASDASMMLRRYGRSFDWASLLPDAADAEQAMRAHGIAFPGSIGPRSVKEYWFAARGLAKKSIWAWLMLAIIGRRRSDYPLVYGYSDFFVVPAGAAVRFGRYCEVFGALNMFAEVAVPTALALAVEQVVTELPANMHFVGHRKGDCRNPHLRGQEMWTREEQEAFAARFTHKSIEGLRSDFPTDALYVHPVKLSGWT